MAQYPTLGDFLLGFQGLAIMRSWALDPSGVPAQTALMLDMTNHLGEEPWKTPITETTVHDGYAQWAATYDNPGNPMLIAEEPIVRGIIDRYQVGDALDAACGTGRHAAYLASLGHTVVGVDTTPEMLQQAKAKVPSARFEVGDLSSIPLPNNSVDLAICTLALTHWQNLSPSLRELARVTRPRGHIVLSDVHPFFVMLGGQALYQHTQGELGLVWNHFHLPSDYLNAFRDAGLEVIQCLEPVWGDAELATAGFTPEMSRSMESAFRGTPIVIVWEMVKRSPSPFDSPDITGV